MMLAAWKPEHMWRMGPGASPSRARRAAVRTSSGAMSPHASSVWLTVARRKMACSVRTCMSSPECEEAMTASSACVRWNESAAPDSIRAINVKGLTALRRVTIVSGSPSARSTARSAPTCTIAPRWRLSTMFPRRTSTSAGGGALRGHFGCVERPAEARTPVFIAMTGHGVRAPSDGTRPTDPARPCLRGHAGAPLVPRGD